ncbi:hypothetical protein L6164_033377 [Bauhinia variegata]|uniref:Uncharacterized protein n=1 Tax=Bauhinia variegata TaxID=167791 RepID=A0ACB9KRN6_BAUVA|nr:hypothetical protein L6164_033377 [Bauhinia variegata]
MLAEGWFSECDGCWKHERDALLHLKAISSKAKSQHNYWLSTWVDGTDCCQWENIECNTRRRVSKLNLHSMRDDRLENWYLNLSDFQAFDDIKSLDLTDNSIAGFVENKGNVRFSWQTKLEGLVLSDNQLTNDIISFLSGFHHLKSLDLSYNQLEGSWDISGICALSKLEMLDLSFNYNISGFVVPQGTNIYLGNLKILLLNELKIDGTLVAREFGDLEKLEHLELDGSFNIGNEFFKSIGALTSLKVLSLCSCGIKGSLPFAGWSKLKMLEEFDISSTPRWKGQFMTFDARSYEGNSFLCGPPLNKSCTPYGIFPNAFDVEAVNNGGIVDMEFFYISFVVSYTSILFEMAAVLYIKPQLREKWFYFIESIISYCHCYFREWFPIQHM